MTGIPAENPSVSATAIQQTRPDVEYIFAPPSWDGSEGLLAIIVRASHANPGVTFLTDPALPQQLATIDRPSGWEVPPHIHHDWPRQVTRTQEVLVVRRGIITVTFYTSDHLPVCERTLGPCDLVSLIAGGHGVKFITDASLAEVKTGPYAGSREKDKVEFVPAVSKTPPTDSPSTPHGD